MKIEKEVTNIYVSSTGSKYKSYKDCIRDEVYQNYRDNSKIMYLIEEVYSDRHNRILKEVYSTEEKANKHIKELVLTPEYVYKFKIYSLIDLHIIEVVIDYEIDAPLLDSIMEERIKEFEDSLATEGEQL